jgi:hypothetical protein
MRAVLLTAVLAGIHAGPGMAHGPCGICLSPTFGTPGTEVAIRHRPAYWIIWNGAGLPQDGALRPVHRKDARTIELVRCSGAPRTSVPVLLCPARRNLSFVVPEVPPGRYPVVIYDGSENGFHYTWDLFRVTAEDHSGGFHLRAPLLPLLAGAVLLLLVGAYGARRSISHSSPSRR